MTEERLPWELRELAKWADANERKVPVAMGNVLRFAAELLERNVKNGKDKGKTYR